MIGGSDKVFAGAGPADEGVFIVSVLRRDWPALVVQDASAAHVVAADDPAIAGMMEFFVYRSRADFEAWMAEGTSGMNADTMIHVILGPTSMTIVTEKAGSTTQRLGAKLSREVAIHRLVPERGRGG